MGINKIRRTAAAMAIAGAMCVGGLMGTPATANVAGGCTGMQLWLADAAQSRSCVAYGPTKYVAATPNMWQITVKRGTTLVASITSGLATPATANLPTKPGDVVTVVTQPVRTSYGSIHTGFFAII